MLRSSGSLFNNDVALGQIQHSFLEGDIIVRIWEEKLIVLLYDMSDSVQAKEKFTDSCPIAIFASLSRIHTHTHIHTYIHTYTLIHISNYPYRFTPKHVEAGLFI